MSLPHALKTKRALLRFFTVSLAASVVLAGGFFLYSQNALALLEPTTTPGQETPSDISTASKFVEVLDNDADASKYGGALNANAVKIGGFSEAYRAFLQLGNNTQSNVADIQKSIANNGLVITVPKYIDTHYFPGIVWSTKDHSPSLPKLALWGQMTNSGSKLYFGTSNDYSKGVTNQALTIDQNGNVGVGTSTITKWFEAPVLEVSGERGTLTARTTSVGGLSTLRFVGPSAGSDVHVNFNDTSGNLTVSNYKGGYKDVFAIAGTGNVGIGTTDQLNGQLQIGKDSGSGSTKAGSAVRLSLAPPHHTGGDWYFTTRDNDPSTGYAYLDIGYGGSLLTMRHDGRVGVGTKDPGAALEVVSQSQDALRITGNEGGRTWRFGFGSDGNLLTESPWDRWKVYLDDNNDSPDSFEVYHNGTASGSPSQVFGTYDEKVGIGTTSPQSQLTISRNAAAAAGQLELRDTGGINDGQYNAIRFTQGATGATPLGSIRSMYRNSGNPDLAFFTRDFNTNVETEKMRIGSNGTVSIPGALTAASISMDDLHVNKKMYLGQQGDNMEVGCRESKCWTDANGIIGFPGLDVRHGSLAFYPDSNAFAFIDSSAKGPAGDYGPLNLDRSFNDIWAGNAVVKGNIYVPYGAIGFNSPTTAGTGGIAASDFGYIYGEHNENSEVSRMIFSLGDNAVDDDQDKFIFRTNNWNSGNRDVMTITGKQIVMSPTATGSVNITSPSNDMLRIRNDTSEEADIRYLTGVSNWEVGTNNQGNGTNKNHFYIYDGSPGVSQRYALTVQQGTGNVGIGTTQPTAKLKIGNGGSIWNGGAQLDLTGPRGDGWGGVTMSFSPDPNHGWHWNAYPDGRFLIHSYSGGTWPVRMSFSEDGNIGIGREGPTRPLDVNGSTSVGTTSSDYLPGGYNWNYTLLLNGQDTTSIGFHDSGSNVGSIRFKNNLFTIGENDGWGIANAYFPGSVGIGTTDPKAMLDVRGAVYIGSSDQNKKIKFTDGWTGYPDATLGSEISNDTSNYKTLMIVGNKSAGGARSVSVWDILNVNGNENITGNLTVGGTINGAISRLSTSDTRNENPSPTTYSQGITSDFKLNSTDGLNDGGSYHGVLNFRQWSSSTDWSGGGVRQLAFTDNDNLWVRGNGTSSASWNGWKQIIMANSNGKVGIGTTDPGAPLTVDVANGYGGTALKVETKSEPSAYNLSLGAVNDASASVYWTFNQRNANVDYPSVMTFKAGNIGIGTASPDTKLDVNGNIRIPNTGKIVFGSAGAPNDYIELNDRTAGGALLNLIQDGRSKFYIEGVSGNVGIGTTQPGYPLEISRTGGTRAQVGIYSQGDVATDLFFGSNGKKDRFSISSRDSAENGGYDLKIWRNNGSWDPMTTFDWATGNVGIGTESPGYKLDVVGRANDWKAKFGGPDGYITIGPANSGWAHIYTDRANFIFDKDVWSIPGGFSSYDKSDLTLKTNGTPRLTIKNSTGNVGIGTTSPDNKLTVIDSGSKNTSNTSAWVYSGNGFDTTKESLGSTSLLVQNGSSRSDGSNELTNIGLVATAYGGQKNYAIIVPQGAGRVGIGTSAPIADLDVNGNIRATSAVQTAQFCLGLNNPSCISNWSQASQWSTNASGIGYTAGSVGIGTQTPGAKLDVQGNLKVVNHYFDANDDGWLRLKDADNGNYKDLAVNNQWVQGQSWVWGNLVLGGVVTDGTSSNRFRICGPNGSCSLAGELIAGRIRLSADSGSFSSAESIADPGMGGIHIPKNAYFATAGGNVGIGTTNPLAQLHISQKDSSGTAYNSLSIGSSPSVGSGGSTELNFVGYGSSGDGAYIDYSRNNNRKLIFRSIETKINGEESGHTPVMTLNNIGYVGIGSSNPRYKLDVDGVISLGGGNGNLDPAGGISLAPLQGSGKSLVGWNRTAGGGEMDFIANRDGGSIGGFIFYDYSNSGVLTNLVTIKGNGNVGIGISNPIYKLDVNGDVNVSYLGEKKKIANLSASEKLAYATDRIGFDVAEIFESQDTVETGDILVVGDQERKVKKSSGTYQGAIVGVVSGAPALLFEGSELKIGARPDRFVGGSNPPVALAGRIPVKVSLENGPIETGDYLTTSSTPGVAMKATEPGIAIGIALEEYKGTGNNKILVFLNLGERNGSTAIKELQEKERVQANLINSLLKRLNKLETRFRW